MTVALSYEFKSFNRVENGLRALASQNKKQTDETLGEWTKAGRAYLKGYGYPSQTGNPQPFKTDRQRRWFFWALKAGIITVPYSRTGRLANSWRAVRRGPSDWVIENSAAYAALVVGAGRQARYHEDNWWTAESLIKPRVSSLTTQLATDLVALAGRRF